MLNTSKYLDYIKILLSCNLSQMLQFCYQDPSEREQWRSQSIVHARAHGIIDPIGSPVILLNYRLSVQHGREIRG